MKKLNFKFICLVTFVLLGLLYGCGGSEKEGKMQTDYTTEEKSEESPATEKKSEAQAQKDEAMPAPDDDTNEKEIRSNTEEYDKIIENPFKNVKQEPLSTFSIDVDNASYSNIRRYINGGQLPPPNAVRIEEMINYFDYDYPDAKGEHPFSIITEMGECPWNAQHKLVHIGLQGKKLNYRDLKPSNLVFLVDASGSMADANKLPLLKKSLKLLLDGLNRNDKIAIVAYAGAAGLVLPSTPATEKNKILSALNELEAGGSTAGGEGIELAYQIAKENFIQGGNNRVILATDGDFNVGVSSDIELVNLIEQKRKEDIYVTICGFGMGNYKDGKMEKIADKGNGNYFYIDNISEAKKVFVTEMRANLFTIAKDVKLQIEFNPTQVRAYRLIGYENRTMANEDFDDDTKDAGELGAGHTVTALYEIVPVNSNSEVASNNKDLKYQETVIKNNSENKGEWMTIKFRYKPIKSDVSKLLQHTVRDEKSIFSQSSNNYRFSAAVAGFGLLLRNSQYKGNLEYDKIIAMAKAAKGTDEEGYRAEFIRLVENAKLMQK